MKNKNYHTVRTCSKSNCKMVERDTITIAWHYLIIFFLSDEIGLLLHLVELVYDWSNSYIEDINLH